MHSRFSTRRPRTLTNGGTVYRHREDDRYVSDFDEELDPVIVKKILAGEPNHGFHVSDDFSDFDKPDSSFDGFSKIDDMGGFGDSDKDDFGTGGGGKFGGGGASR